MREQRERNRSNAKERVDAQAWQEIAKTLASQLARGQPVEQPKPAVDAAPTREQFKDWDDFQTAKTAHTAKLEARQEFERLRSQDAQERQRAAEQFESDRITYEHQTRNTDFARSVPDFVDVTDREDINVPEPACIALKEQPNSSAIVYAFGHNPEIVSQLWRQSALKQAAYIGRLSAYLASQSPQISNAAPAGRTVGAKPSPSGDLPDDTESYMKAANKRFGPR